MYVRTVYVSLVSCKLLNIINLTNQTKTSDVFKLDLYFDLIIHTYNSLII